MRRSCALAVLALCVSIRLADAFPPCTGIEGDPDCYAILGVQPSAKPKDIKKGKKSPAILSCFILMGCNMN